MECNILMMLYNFLHFFHNLIFNTYLPDAAVATSAGGLATVEPTAAPVVSTAEDDGRWPTAAEGPGDGAGGMSVLGGVGGLWEQKPRLTGLSQTS